MKSGVLTPTDHSRNLTGMTYVYPVFSRRAGGLSVGINLSTNNACNWRCIYCQVEDLARGASPPVDIGLLEQELRRMLNAVVAEEVLEEWLPEGYRRLSDVAFSGNGEPTSSPQFPEAVACVERVLGDLGLLGTTKVVLITNGSRAARPAVQAGLRILARAAGEIWFKVDRGDAEGILQVNGVHLRREQVLRHLDLAARLCPTWVQTCMFALDGSPPDPAQRRAYLDLLRTALGRGVPLRGVYLYGVARPSHQPEATRIGPVPEGWLEALAGDIHALGLRVVVTP